MLRWIGVEAEKPLVTQVSRFDPWKDPLGVIAAYWLIKPEVHGLQLALAGSMALDDPEGWEIYRQIQDAAKNDPAIHLFTNLTAFQRHSDVVIQKSIREGFGLVVSEALWKETPVVAGRAGGIPLQMRDGAGGFLIADELRLYGDLLGTRQPRSAVAMADRGCCVPGCLRVVPSR